MATTLHSRIATLVALVVVMTASAAQAQLPVGVWISVLDRYGIVLPHVEVLLVGADGRAETRIYARRTATAGGVDCENRTLAEAGPCTPGRRHVTGTVRFIGQTGVFTFDVTATSQDGPEDFGTAKDRTLARELFWLGFGAPWQAEASGNTLKLARRTRPVLPQYGIDGSKEVTIERIFHRADPALATELLGLSVAGEQSLAKLTCVLPNITDRSAAAASFRELMADATRLARGRDAAITEALAAGSPEKAERALLMSEVLSGGGSSTELEKLSATTGIPAARIERVRRDIMVRSRATAADEVLFPGLEQHHEAIRRCYALWFE